MPCVTSQQADSHNRVSLVEQAKRVKDGLVSFLTVRLETQIIAGKQGEVNSVSHATFDLTSWIYTRV